MSYAFYAGVMVGASSGLVSAAIATIVSQAAIAAICVPSRLLFGDRSKFAYAALSDNEDAAAEEDAFEAWRRREEISKIEEKKGTVVE